MTRLIDLYETLRRLRPSQPGHRIVLRLRARGAREVDASASWSGVESLPQVARRPRRPPFDRPEGDAWTCAGALARLDAEGRLVFDHAPPTALERYHAAYGEVVRAAAEDGDLARARRWLPAVTGENHPYVRSRRILALVEARVLGLPEADGTLGRDAGAIARELERDVRGNHLLANAVALHRVGHAFRGGHAPNWAELGAAELTSCVREQVLADGIHYERSPEYQGLVLEHLLIALETAASAGVPPPRGVEDGARRLATALKALRLPDGKLLRRGDGAPGIALPLEALLEWATSRTGPLPAARRGTRWFTAAGFSVLEDEATRSAITLFAGAPCPRDLPAHGHADALACELVLRGVRVIASAGTAAYGDGPARDTDRLPGAFAAVTLDGRASAVPYGAFRMGARGWVRRLSRWDEDGVTSIEACADGFSRRNDRCIHRRVVALAGDVAVVIDEWTGRRDSVVELAWPLLPGLVPTLDDHGIQIHGPGASYRWMSSAGEARIESGTFAAGLGMPIARSVIWNRVRVARPARVVHVVAAGGEPIAVEVAPAPGGVLRVRLRRSGDERIFHVGLGQRP